jgi:hypothetical protein
VGDPGSSWNRAGDLGDRSIRNTEEDEVGAVVDNGNAALGEPSAHRGSHAPATADDLNALDHNGSSSVAG